MKPTLSKKLQDKITRIEENFDHTELQFMADAIFEAAACYWLGLDEDDFCLQSSGGGEMLVFGGTNRLRWTPWQGFQPDRSYCTPSFLANFDRIGPVPGAVVKGTSPA